MGISNGAGDCPTTNPFSPVEGRRWSGGPDEGRRWRCCALFCEPPPHPFAQPIGDWALKPSPPLGGEGTFFLPSTSLQPSSSGLTGEPRGTWGGEITTGSSDLRCAPSEDDGFVWCFRLRIWLHDAFAAEVGESKNTRVARRVFRDAGDRVFVCFASSKDAPRGSFAEGGSRLDRPLHPLSARVLIARAFQPQTGAWRCAGTRTVWSDPAVSREPRSTPSLGRPDPKPLA